MFLKFSGFRPSGTRSLLKPTVFALALFCGLVLLGCAKGAHETAAQDQQTRPRRIAADGANSKEKNQGMSDPKTANEAADAPGDFRAALAKALSERGTTPAAVCDESDPVARRVLADYGAMFVASRTVLPPPACVFASEAEVTKFQQAAGAREATVAGTKIELQPAAMEALLKARAEARAAGLDITPRGGTEAARRDYADTRRLWDTRFLPALTHWQKRGRLTKEQTARLRALPLTEQVREVLELEERGIYFSKDFSKSILYSIAAPGTSQHIAMLALDVTQFADARVRRILARHGWFQTVKSDLPHFTYLGVEEKDLPSLGLKSVTSDGQVFWIPNIATQG